MALRTQATNFGEVVVSTDEKKKEPYLIKRKPVPTVRLDGPSPDDDDDEKLPQENVENSQYLDFDVPPDYAEVSQALVQNVDEFGLQTDVQADSPSSSQQHAIESVIDGRDEETLVHDSIDPSQSKEALDENSKWKTALAEARHFAGGLIPKPFESTKFFTILRHSHGIVFYQGVSTTLAITIFSDHPLPPDRTLWLQKKGWTGKTGLKAKALMGINNSWINVTPSHQAETSQLPPADERAWQRDIKKLTKKAPKEMKHRVVRETDILRIPCSAEDGYCRIVLCGGNNKKVLCPSPAFRLVSSSTSPSSIKGASLSTLPMELGLKVLSSTAKTAAGNALQPVTNTIQNQVSPYKPSAMTQEVGTVLYDVSGVQDKFDNASQQYDGVKDLTYKPVTDSLAPASKTQTLSEDKLGPPEPYPVRVDGKVIRGTGRSTADFGIPTANVAGVLDEISLRLSGVYCSWAKISISRSNTKERTITDWLPAIIVAMPDFWSAPSPVPKNIIRAHVLHHFQDPNFIDAKVSLLIMAYLRGCKSYNAMSFFERMNDDIGITKSALGNEAWSAAAALDTMQMRSNKRSLTERCVDLRNAGQKHIDRVPVHRIGVRTPTAGLKDKALGNGGLWILR